MTCTLEQQQHNLWQAHRFEERLTTSAMQKELLQIQTVGTIALEMDTLCWTPHHHHKVVQHTHPLATCSALGTE
jgi:hypothetical protein